MNLRVVRSVAVSLTALALSVSVGSALAQPASPDALRKAFADADANKDGVLNIDEYVANVVYVFKQVDRNRDGYITVEEARAYWVDFRGELFKAADRNGDGKLSVGEAVAAKVIDFFEIDTNHDGVISIEEILVYERALPIAAPRK
jgi:Ca2+-binding EF-hand superfamily protein